MKNSTSSDKSQGFEYWSSRKEDDEKKDWPYNQQTWLDDYTESEKHPHRMEIINLMSSWEAKHGQSLTSVLEIGCNTGPNLSLIKRNFPDIHVTGIDANVTAIEKAKKQIQGTFFNHNIETLGQFDPQFDVVIADAVLMYIGPRVIDDVMNMLSKNCTKMMILFEWNAISYYGVLKDYHWARNYKEHLRKRGFTVIKKKLTQDIWSNQNWLKNGFLYCGYRAQ